MRLDAMLILHKLANQIQGLFSVRPPTVWLHGLGWRLDWTSSVEDHCPSEQTHHMLAAHRPAILLVDQGCRYRGNKDALQNWAR